MEVFEGEKRGKSREGGWVGGRRPRPQSVVSFTIPFFQRALAGTQLRRSRPPFTPQAPFFLFLLALARTREEKKEETKREGENDRAPLQAGSLGKQKNIKKSDG